MSAAARLLDRLDGVRQTAPDRWLARCPNHDDRSPSLSIREIDDRVLVYDFGGCTIDGILTALGMQLGDLYERPLGHQKLRTHSRIPAKDVLLALDLEVTAAALLIEGATIYPLNEIARDRLAVAVYRIGRAAAYIRGMR